MGHNCWSRKELLPQLPKKISGPTVHPVSGSLFLRQFTGGAAPRSRLKVRRSEDLVLGGLKVLGLKVLRSEDLVLGGLKVLGLKVLGLIEFLCRTIIPRVETIPLLSQEFPTAVVHFPEAFGSGLFILF